MINHRCSCCYPVFDGPTSSLKTCHGCGNQFFSYQAGGYVRQQPYYCVDCVEKNSVVEVIGHADGLIKYNKPTGDVMVYGDKDYKRAIVLADAHKQHPVIPSPMLGALGMVSRALLAAQEHIAFLETELTEEARINGQGAQRELGLRTKIDGLQSKINCLEIQIKELERVAEAKEKNGK